MSTLPSIFRCLMYKRMSLPLKPRAFVSARPRFLTTDSSTTQSSNHIAALASLITDATKVIEAHYRNANPSNPEVPLLDDTEAHPVDHQLSSKELRAAIQTIEGACAQLSTTVARPNHTILNKFMGYLEAGCLNIVLRFKVADILLETPEGMHISEIGKKIGVEDRKIGRILRLLATNHVFSRSSDEGMKVNVHLPDVLADKEWGHSYSSSHTPFNRATGYPGSMFQYYQNDKPEGTKRGARLGLGMVGWGAACEDHAAITEFPWNELKDGASICDVGGGVGNITMQLAKAYPKLQLILQDLPGRIQQAKDDIWPRKCPEAIADNRIQFVPLDFFEGPPVSGHNWPDDDSIKILMNVRRAMAPRSRVIIQDYILQHANRLPEEDSELKQAPEPMLPNFGAGRIRQYNLDIHMMSILNSEERRLSDFIKLGEAAGLRFVKFWDIGDTGLVEYGAT